MYFTRIYPGGQEMQISGQCGLAVYLLLNNDAFRNAILRI
jgi:hypothetical protein